MIEIVCDRCGAKADMNAHIVPAGFILPFGWVSVMYGEVAGKNLLIRNYCPECIKKEVEKE